MIKRFISYIRYLLASTNRHGVHSPFVYALLDKGINGNRGKPLLIRLNQYFGEHRVIRMDLTGVSQATPRKDVIFYIPGIHDDNSAYSKWVAISKDKNVQLSIDLWQGGVVVNSSDFKEKQHFVLRWKG